MPGTACVYVECPRDAWQGFATVIPTEVKVGYVRSLLEAGFTRLDLGSFVSPRAVPQTADTEALLAALTVPEGVELSCVVLNERGVERAATTRATHVGFPLSVSETFQRRNARQTLAEAWALLARLQAAARAAGLGFTVYLSMGFGNPYGEPWRPEDTARALARVRQHGVTRVVLADTVGTATPERLEAVLEAAAREGAAASELGLHLHAPRGAGRRRSRSRWRAGCVGSRGPWGGSAGARSRRTRARATYRPKRSCPFCSSAVSR